MTVQLSALKVKSEHDNELVEALVVSNHKCSMFTKTALYTQYFGQILPLIKSLIACQWAPSSVQSMFQLANEISFLNMFKMMHS